MFTSRLFYQTHFRTFPLFPHIVLVRTSPHLSALLRVSLSFPFLAFPCFTMIILLSVASLAFVSFSFVSPFLTFPYIGYYVTHFVTQTSVIPYIPVISIYTYLTTLSLLLQFVINVTPQSYSYS